MDSRYIERNLKLVDYIDGMMIVDKDCIIRQYYSAHPDIGNLTQEDVIGRSLFDVYPTLRREDSHIYHCIRTGEPSINYEQSYRSFKGDVVNSSCTTLPIREKGEIVGAIDMVIYKDIRAKEKRLSLDVNVIDLLTRNQNRSYDLADIVTADPRMLAIKEKIRNTANASSPVLVYGQTGTGKELVVNAIHRCGPRKGKPFIAQNCAAIPSTLLESILFGTTSGSFTGARDTQGLFELANGGTLFLDEINSMELEAQAKLLRVLEEGTVRRIGDKVSRKIDVRVVAAVNEDPEECVRSGKIRADVFYRLCVIRYDIPPLRQRMGDVPLLMDYFRKYYNRKLGVNIIGYSDEVVDIFMKYRWPGNVRELKNVIESAYQVNLGPILTADNLPERIVAGSGVLVGGELPQAGLSLTEMVNNFEKSIIAGAYARSHGSLTAAAAELKISKQTLLYKLRKYGLVPDVK